MRTLITLLITVISLTSVAVGQSKKDKVEIGAPASFTIPSETRHNLQISSGIGFRF